MASRSLNKLSARQVQLAGVKNKDYKLSDGGGLYLFVRKSGSKSWVFRYTKPTTKKVTNLAVGAYPEYSLSEAREICATYRKQVKKGSDPKINRDLEKANLSEEQSTTLRAVAKMWFDSRVGSVKPKGDRDLLAQLEHYVFPAIGDTPISKINAPQTIALLREPEANDSLWIVQRVCTTLNSIMTFAVNFGFIHHNPLVGIRTVFKRPKAKNFPALSPNDLPELLQKMNTSHIYPVGRHMFEFQLHTMVRPVEAARATWDEIDFDKKVWTIPAERMKCKRVHKVPLTDQVLAILESVKIYSRGREFIFPSDRKPGQPCHKETVNRLLKRAGFQGRTCAHGLRALASTTLNGLRFDAELIELSLSHVDKNVVRRAYARNEYLEQRRKIMEWWSDHIERASIGSLSIASTVRVSAE